MGYSRDKRDIYYRAAKSYGYRARSAFKLLQINRQFNILTADTNRIVDLCAAPGSWTEVCRDYQISNSDNNTDSTNTAADATTIPVRHIVSVDLAPIHPFNNSITNSHVTIIEGDITSQSTALSILSLFNSNRVDLVLYDGAPDTIGISDLDEYLQHSLFLSALTLATVILQSGGTFIGKIFRGPKLNQIITICRLYFSIVLLAKPAASRNSSIEGFIICKQYNTVAALNNQISLTNPIRLNQLDSIDSNSNNSIDSDIVEFIHCGDELGFDSDQSYNLNKILPNNIYSSQLQQQQQQQQQQYTISESTGDSVLASTATATTAATVDYEHLLPSAAPINPPFAISLAMKKQQKMKTQILNNNNNNSNSNTNNSNTSTATASSTTTISPSL